MSLQTGILLLLFAGIALGGILWWQSLRESTAAPSQGTPDVYTITNVQRHKDHYVEQGGVVQAFILLETHPQSGYFHIEVTPPDGHPLNRDHSRICGWTREILSNRLIRQGDLLRELPLKMRQISCL